MLTQEKVNKCVDAILWLMIAPPLWILPCAGLFYLIAKHADAWMAASLVTPVFILGSVYIYRRAGWAALSILKDYATEPESSQVQSNEG